MITRDQAVEQVGKLHVEFRPPNDRGILIGYDFASDTVGIRLDDPDSPTLWIPRPWVEAR